MKWFWDTLALRLNVLYNIIFFFSWFPNRCTGLNKITNGLTCATENRDDGSRLHFVCDVNNNVGALGDQACRANCLIAGDCDVWGIPEIGAHCSKADDSYAVTDDCTMLGSPLYEACRIWIPGACVYDDDDRSCKVCIFPRVLQASQ